MRDFYKSSKLLVILLLLSMNYAMAQERTVSGTVISQDDNTSLPGVNVLVQGTSSGTVTDIDGNYSINVPENATLVFSFIGFTTQVIPVGNRSTIDVRLSSDVRALSEVVVIGYGTQQRRDATGAVASVKAEDFNMGVIASPEQLIQGKSAGVQITTASGEPGAGVNIRIRGAASVRGGNNPLFVIDGVPLAGDDVSPGGQSLARGGQSPRNPLNFLNPNDIESIDILKDASATAIYGSRGANGVVLITTKGGRGMRNLLEYNTNASLSWMANRYDLLNRDEYLSTVAGLVDNPSELDAGHNTDWQDEISRLAFSHRHDLAYGNSFKTGSYRAAFSYDNQQGIIRNSSMERITGRLNFNNNFFNEKLKVGTQLTISRINDLAPLITDNAGFEGDLLGATYMANPTWSSDPTFQFSPSQQNPNALLEYYQSTTNTNRFLGNAFAEYSIIEDLNFRVNVGIDRSDSRRPEAYSPLLNIGGILDNGRAGISDRNTSSNLMEAFFNYDRDFGNSKLQGVLGYSYQQFEVSGINIQGWGFNTNDLNRMISDLDNASNTILNSIDRSYQQFAYGTNRNFLTTIFPETSIVEIAERPAGLPVQALTGNTYDVMDELQSFFGRVNYSLADKYLFTATLRADGSTRFGGNNKYGYFPSAAVAWRISEEDFAPDFFSDLKVRLGYGVTGNQEIPHNLHRQRQRWGGIGINNAGEVNPPGINNITFNNPGLKWETTSQINLGLDFAFGNGMFSSIIDFYRRNTSDLLIQQTTAQPSPTPFIWRNLDANVINTGIEFTFNYFPIETDRMRLNFSLNLAYNENIVRNLADIIDTGGISGQGLSGAFAQRIANNQPLYAFYLRDFAGFAADGTTLYNDGDFQQFLGKSPLPLWNGGFNINYSIGNFDLTAFFAGQFGHYVYNNTANAFFTKGSLGSGRNVTRDVMDNGESVVNNPEVSTRFLERADFVRMQNLNLGYNINMENVRVIRNLRLFASGQNLFVLTNYSGLDPEVDVNKALNNVPSAGIDYTMYPRPRIVTIGLNATF